MVARRRTAAPVVGDDGVVPERLADGALRELRDELCGLRRAPQIGLEAPILGIRHPCRSGSRGCLSVASLYPGSRGTPTARITTPARAKLVAAPFTQRSIP